MEGGVLEVRHNNNNNLFISIDAALRCDSVVRSVNVSRLESSERIVQEVGAETTKFKSEFRHSASVCLHVNLSIGAVGFLRRWSTTQSDSISKSSGNRLRL